MVEERFDSMRLHMEELRKGTYQHFKGKRYFVIGVAKHSETEEQLVVYKALYEDKQRLWVRPLAMFTESITRDGKTLPRFKYICDYEAP